MMKMKSSRGTTATATSTKCEELAATRDSLVLLCRTAAPQEPRVLEAFLATRAASEKPRNHNQARYTANSERTRKQKGFVVRAFSQSLARPRSLARATERMPARTLVVQVLRADNLIIADIGGTSDPYVRLSIGKQERKTQTKWVRSSPSLSLDDNAAVVRNTD